MEFNPLKYITIKRVINAVQLFISYSLSLLLKRPVVLAKPLTFSIEPTNLCNLKCPECPSGSGELTRASGMMSLALFKKIIDEIQDHTFYLQLFLQGEPYLNRHLPEMIEYARSKKIYSAVSTNGNAFNLKNIDVLMLNAPDKLIFSLDAVDDETYNKYRLGGSFKKAEQNLKLIIKKKREAGSKIPYIELQFIVMKHNEHQLEQFKHYGKMIGADKVALKTMQVYDAENAVKFLPDNEEFRRYILKDGEFKIKNHFRNKCFSIWRTSVFTWDGKVIPCCFDKDALYVLGNIKENKFRDIWMSPAYKSFRKMIMKDRKKIEMCRNCTDGLKLRMTNV